MWFVISVDTVIVGYLFWPLGCRCYGMQICGCANANFCGSRLCLFWIMSIVPLNMMVSLVITMLDLFCININSNDNNKKLCGSRHKMPPPLSSLCGRRSASSRRADRAWPQLSSRFPRWKCSHGLRRSCLMRKRRKRHGDLDLWPFDLESGVRVACDVGYLSGNFSLPRSLCSRLRPDMYAIDRQTDVRQTSDVRQTEVRRHRRLILPPIRGGGIIITPISVVLWFPGIQRREKLRQMQIMSQNVRWNNSASAFKLDG